MPDKSFHNIKKIPVLIISAMVVIIAAGIFYYKSLYNKHTEYLTTMLGKQVTIAGISVAKADEGFINDLHQILLSGNIGQFISDPDNRAITADEMKMFFSKYENFIIGIKLFDNKKNEYTLKKDETGNNWLEQNFILHIQGDISAKEELVIQANNYEYIVPVIQNEIPVGNIVVTVDFQKYFSNIFTTYNLEDYQWEWVLDDSGKIIFSNYKAEVKYSLLQNIADNSSRNLPGSLTHTAGINGKNTEIVSSYYPVSLLRQKFTIVVSSPVEELHSYIFRNSVLSVAVTLAALLVIAGFLYRYIKEQQKEIDKLRLEKEKLLGLIEALPVGLVIHNKTRKILKASKKAADYYSFTDAEKMAGSIYPEPDVKEGDSYFLRHLGSYFRPDQFVILAKEAGEIILFRTSVPVTFEGEDCTLEILVDVTELESARKVEASASTAKSEFLARMSYELRTPLNGIIGMADILERQNLTDESAGVLKLLRRSAEVLLGIINDILDFSKIESGKMILDEIPFSLREEIVYCYDLARTITDESKIELTCSVNDDVPDKVIGDPFRVRQILSNFLNHSISVTSKGKISLACSLKEQADGSIRLAFRIQNTGKSFDNANLRKIFGNRVKLESKSSRDNDETGFGLMLARQLVELMDGEFDVESPSGLDGESGTKIDFTIKIWSNEKPEKNLHFESVTAFGQIRTLVVTGSQTRDEEILGTIHKLGLAMTVTTFQKSTINQIKTSMGIPDKKYHLIVILDDNDFDGFDAAREISENKLSKDLVILIVSSNDKKGNLIKCYSYGVDHYIVKPYDIRELYETIKDSFPHIDRVIPVHEKETVRKDLKILVVEDNKMNQKVIGTMLKCLGYSFDFADDGFAGFIQAKTRRYDVIFMDLIMPQMDGFESARRILEHDSTQLIAAFTADNMPESKRKAELSGIKEFIPKPVRIEDLKKFFSGYFINK